MAVMATDRENMEKRQDGQYEVPIKKEPKKGQPIPPWTPPIDA